jgi:phosphatidylinositol-3-phosphatase
MHAGRRRGAGRLIACVAGVAAALACAWTVAGCGSAHPGRPLAAPGPRGLPPSRSAHVVELVMENKEYGDVIGNRQAPYINALARRYGLATASFAVTHPSLPNYLALTSGSTHGIATDCTTCRVAGPDLAGQLEARRISWNAYMEDLPSPCFRGAGARGYAKKHDPFAYFDDVVTSPARCRKIVPFSRLAVDLRDGTLPTFSFVSPNLCDSTHDCGIGTGDRFLARLVPRLLRELGPNGFLVLTWDEGSSGRGCCGDPGGGHIATIVAGPDVRRGGRDGLRVDHYGVLRTVEDALGLARLGAARDPVHGSLDPLFGRPPTVR